MRCIGPLDGTVLSTLEWHCRLPRKRTDRRAQPPTYNLLLQPCLFSQGKWKTFCHPLSRTPRCPLLISARRCDKNSHAPQIYKVCLDNCNITEINSPVVRIVMSHFDRICPSRGVDIFLHSFWGHVTGLEDLPTILPWLLTKMKCHSQNASLIAVVSDFLLLHR